MIFKARVIDTSCFKKTGKITVRILEKVTPELREDLSFDGDKITSMYDVDGDGGDDNERKIISFDQQAILYTPFGGGEDFGLFYLPMVNSVGLVAEIGNTLEVDSNGQYVWLGGIFTRTAYDPSQPGDINIPSTNIYNTQNGISYDKYFSNEEESLVFKTRSTKLEDPLNPDIEKLDWYKTELENLIVMNKNLISMLHNVRYGGNNSLELSDNGIVLKNDTPNGSTKLYFNNDGDFVLDKNSGGVASSVYSTSDKKLEIKTEDTANEKLTIITQGDETIEISSQDNKNNKGFTLTITTDGVVFNGGTNFIVQTDKVYLGCEGPESGAKPILLSNSDTTSIPEASVSTHIYAN